MWSHMHSVGALAHVILGFPCSVYTLCALHHKWGILSKLIILKGASWCNGSDWDLGKGTVICTSEWAVPCTLLYGWDPTRGVRFARVGKLSIDTRKSTVIHSFELLILKVGNFNNVFWFLFLQTSSYTWIFKWCMFWLSIHDYKFVQLLVWDFDFHVDDSSCPVATECLSIMDLLHFK